MDFVQALKGGSDNAVDYFKSHFGSFGKEADDKFKRKTDLLEAKFRALLNDEDADDKPEFLVPELPKPKREVKGKRKTGAKTSVLKTSVKLTKEEPLDSGGSSTDVSLNSVDSADIVRKSSRLASKGSQVPVPAVQPLPVRKATPNDTFTAVPSSSTRLLPSHKTPCDETFTTASSEQAPVESEKKLPEAKRSSRLVYRSPKADLNTSGSSYATTISSCATFGTAKEGANEPVSPSLPPTKIRCIENVNFEKPNISRPLLDMSAFSTAMSDVQPLGSSTPSHSLLETLKKMPQTPSQTDTARKLKSQKANLYSEECISAQNAAKIKNQDKILQEKSTNVKLIEEKCQEAQKKKEDKIKSSAEEAKRKREERARKVAASREAALLEKKKQIQKQEIEKEMKLKQQREEKLRLEMQKKKQLAAVKQAAKEERKKEDENAKLRKTKKPNSELEVIEYALDHVLESASSDEEEKPRNQVPSWATKECRKRPLLIQAYIDRKNIVRPWFFNESLKYPKLEELFAGVNIKNRPRASSAIWNSTVVDYDEAFPLHD